MTISALHPEAIIQGQLGFTNMAIQVSIPYNNAPNTTKSITISWSPYLGHQQPTQHCVQLME